ncbi:DUF3558 family protein [Actinomycetospora sp. CA-053990]|uniref:DUF3558 family protein n=1 Tax=Actinomycetospora sp. CA-053990 TaxID=3239891 RepID=UPI003D8A816D
MVLVAAACSSPGPAPPPADNRHGAPIPPSSRDLHLAAENPCQRLLTPEQLRSLGLLATSARIVELPGARQCSWNDRERRQTLSLAPWPDRDLLVDTYRTRQLAVFRPDVISDLPVVYQQTAPGAAVCTITTGVTRGQALETTWYSLSDPVNSPPCVAAQRAVELVLAGIPTVPAR